MHIFKNYSEIRVLTFDYRYFGWGCWTQKQGPLLDTGASSYELIFDGQHTSRFETRRYREQRGPPHTHASAWPVFDFESVSKWRPFHTGASLLRLFFCLSTCSAERYEYEWSQLSTNKMLMFIGLRRVLYHHRYRYRYLGAVYDKCTVF